MANDTKTNSVKPYEERLDEIMAMDCTLFEKYMRAIRLTKTSAPRVLNETRCLTYDALRKQKEKDPKTHADMRRIFNHLRERAKAMDADPNVYKKKTRK